jgi:hypothetical protein
MKILGKSWRGPEKDSREEIDCLNTFSGRHARVDVKLSNSLMD